MHLKRLRPPPANHAVTSVLYPADRPPFFTLNHVELLRLLLDFLLVFVILPPPWACNFWMRGEHFRLFFVFWFPPSPRPSLVRACLFSRNRDLSIVACTAVAQRQPALRARNAICSAPQVRTRARSHHHLLRATRMRILAPRLTRSERLPLHRLHCAGVSAS